MNMVKMEQYQGFAACLSACFCIGLATFTGMPVSTTHTKTTAIMGVGAEKSIRTVKWGLAGQDGAHLDPHVPRLRPPGLRLHALVPDAVLGMHQGCVLALPHCEQ